MLCEAEVAVCPEIHAEHINAMWASRRVGVLNLAVGTVTARL